PPPPHEHARRGRAIGALRLRRSLGFGAARGPKLRLISKGFPDQPSPASTGAPPVPASTGAPPVPAPPVPPVPPAPELLDAELAPWPSSVHVITRSVGPGGAPPVPLEPLPHAASAAASRSTTEPSSSALRMAMPYVTRSRSAATRRAGESRGRDEASPAERLD